ncbi:MAG: hypothetical protein ACRDHP_13900 [Ktedonobacterales bacterium]
MKSLTSQRFRTLYADLPSDAQRQVRAAYSLFKQNPRHGSLQFKRVSPGDSTVYSARVGAHYRAIGILDADTVTWTWVGSHEEYNTITHRR